MVSDEAESILTSTAFLKVDDVTLQRLERTLMQPVQGLPMILSLAPPSAGRPLGFGMWQKPDKFATLKVPVQ
jgi:hypothetical protein